MGSTSSTTVTVLFCLLAIYTQALEATLVTNASVACPDDVVTFTCTVTGTSLMWIIDAPPDSGLSQVTSNVRSNIPINEAQLVGIIQEFKFEIVRTAADEGKLRSTLTTVSNISSYNGSVVTCVGQEQGPLTIQLADPPSPLNPLLVGIENGATVSIVTLLWDRFSTSGGVDIIYVLTISPPPVSGSYIATQINITEITVSYNTQYNVSIRAENCAGSSDNAIVMFELVNCLTPSAADPIVLENVPTVTTEGTTLTIRCPNDEGVTSTCESDGRWSPDPANYDCMTPTTTPIICGDPESPSNGSVNVGNQSPPYVEGTTVTFACDDGLFPNDTRPSTCEQSGLWEPNPGNLACRERPVNCSVPDEPLNGTILDYSSIDTIEGSVITFQCNPGLSPEGVMTATCTNVGVWSPDPAGVECTLNVAATEQLTLLSYESAITVSVIVSSILALVLGVIISVVSVLLYNKCRRGTGQSSSQPPTELKQVGPIYEEPEDFKPDPNTEGNVAYGHVQPPVH